MEKRVVLFFVLSFIIVVGYPYLAKKFGLVPPPPLPIEEKTVIEKGKREREEGPKTIVPLPQEVEAPDEEELITVETDLYRVVLSNRGGAIVEWELREYIDDLDLRNPIRLFEAVPGMMHPLSIVTGDTAKDGILAESLYAVDGQDLNLSKDRASGYISFVFKDEDKDLYVNKTITFQNDTYILGIDIDLRGADKNYGISLGTNFGVVDWVQEGFFGFIGPITRINGEMYKDKPDDIGQKINRDGPIQWVALQDKYFIAALIPQDGQEARIEKADDGSISAIVQVRADRRQTLELYAGPKEFERLSRLNKDLEDTIDFGWFMFGSWSLVRAIAKPLFHVMQFLFDYTRNYGIAIIILTIGIRSLFIPLMHKSYKAMKSMQVLQPEIKKLQKKYKDNKEKLNREMVDLYRKHGANPVSGCLPVLLQLPVFVALFNVLYTTIELRQAPFMLWIQDLSVKDPFFVLPVLMGASMFLQQKMQPTAMDPAQAKLMLFLPVILTVVFVKFPAGLVLYWVTNNILTILQQYITKKYFEGKPSVVTTK